MMIVCGGLLYLNVVPTTTDWRLGSNSWAHWRDSLHGWPFEFYSTTQLKMSVIENTNTSFSWFNLLIDTCICILSALVIALLFELQLRGKDLQFRQWKIHRNLLLVLCSTTCVSLWLNLTPPETVSVVQDSDFNDVIKTYKYRRYSYGWPIQGIATNARAEQTSDEGYLLTTPLQPRIHWNYTLVAVNIIINIVILGLVVFIFQNFHRVVPKLLA